MFFHRQELQHQATPDRPDAVYARKLQEVLGGQYGEITVAMQYGFQSWNAHLPGKYRDLLYGIGAEEFGHVEMLATMIAQLLEKAPVGTVEGAVQDDPTVAAIIGGTDPQHAIVAGPVRGPSTRTATLVGRVRDRERQPARGLHGQRERRDAGPRAGRAALPHDRRRRREGPPGVPARATRCTRTSGSRRRRSCATRASRSSRCPARSRCRRRTATCPTSTSTSPTASTRPRGAGRAARPPTARASSPTWPSLRGVPMPPPTTPDERFHGTTGKPSTLEKAKGAVKDALHKD